MNFIRENKDLPRWCFESIRSNFENELLRFSFGSALYIKLDRGEVERYRAINCSCLVRKHARGHVMGKECDEKRAISLVNNVGITNT